MPALATGTRTARVTIWQSEAMPVPQVPPRMIWAVELMDPQPGDNVLEIGCGPGYGAELSCQRLTSGKLFAIDRS